MKCQYCKQEAKQVTGKEIYPHRPDLHHKDFYQCEPCGAYVGCHPTSTVPLGELADKETRTARQKAHAAFDPIWKNKEMSRHKAYHWLSSVLGIKHEKTHIGMFDAETCRKVEWAVKSRAEKKQKEWDRVAEHKAQ